MLAWKELIGIMRYRLDMFEVSECKINGNRMKTVEGVISVFSGVQEGRAKAGVGEGSIYPSPLLFLPTPTPTPWEFIKHYVN